jgi:hypothetical protein
MQERPESVEPLERVKMNEFISNNGGSRLGKTESNLGENRTRG